jgi:molybdopterin-synthase adenylyltransferase
MLMHLKGPHPGHGPLACLERLSQGDPLCAGLSPTVNDEQLLRYSRQIYLPAIGFEGQERLLRSRVLIIGLGGLGSPVALYLAAAGVGSLRVVDFDRVDLTNLQRQILHTTGRLGMAKVDSAVQALAALNPEIQVESYQGLIDAESLPRLLNDVDLVVDACDNAATRFAVNTACQRNHLPLVSGAAIRAEGQVAVFPGTSGGPCYQCLYPQMAPEDETCSNHGILSPLVGIVGAIQATETIKVLTGAGQTLAGRLLLIDALTMEFRTLRLAPDPGCPICSCSGDSRSHQD